MSNKKMINFEIQKVTSKSNHLQAIKLLADRNSATLGFLPYGAFDRLADDERILACISSEGECLGYLLFGTNKHRVKLTHLCVSDKWRGRGIARALVNYLRRETSDLQGILVSCRRDYNLRTLWSNLGFVALSERDGKAQDGSILTEWWLDYGHPNLFSILAQQRADSRMYVVIDANIFYDLVSGQADGYSHESKALLSDWLASEIEIFLTDEIYNEIDRNEDIKERKQLKNLLTQFSLITHNQEKFDITRQRIRHLFPQNMSHSDRSDLCQLAKAISSENVDVPFFVTRDRRLLEEVEDFIYKEFKLRIIHPVELIIKLDELRRVAEYQPDRLAGTSIEKRRIQSGFQEYIIDTFLANHLGETKASFRQKINLYLSNPKRFECLVIGRSENREITLFKTGFDFSAENSLALVVLDKEYDGELVVPILRCKNDQLAATALRHYILSIILTATSEGKQFTRVTDSYIDRLTGEALKQDNFLNIEHDWLKVNLSGAQRISEVSNTLSRSLSQHKKGYTQYISLVEILNSSDQERDWRHLFEIEKILSPVKIIDAQVPTFIVPIKPWWAKDLFDEELAETYLWGAQEKIALRRECVYYRSSNKTCQWQAPGRILWYVSKSRKYSGAPILGAIRACSRLEEYIIGKPKELYKQFRHLGIYDFKNVREAAKGDLEKDVMALRFSDTELFRTPIRLNQIQGILGNRVSLQAPYRISAEAFAELYNAGTSYS